MYCHSIIELINANHTRYFESSNVLKKRMTLDILSTIQQGGRFIKLMNGKWITICDTEARQKIAHAIQHRIRANQAQPPITTLVVPAVNMPITVAHATPLERMEDQLPHLPSALRCTKPTTINQAYWNHNDLHSCCHANCPTGAPPHREPPYFEDHHTHRKKAVALPDVPELAAVLPSALYAVDNSDANRAFARSGPEQDDFRFHPSISDFLQQQSQKYNGSSTTAQHRFVATTKPLDVSRSSSNMFDSSLVPPPPPPPLQQQESIGTTMSALLDRVDAASGMTSQTHESGCTLNSQSFFEVEDGIEQIVNGVANEIKHPARPDEAKSNYLSSSSSSLSSLWNRPGAVRSMMYETTTGENQLPPQLQQVIAVPTTTTTNHQNAVNHHSGNYHHSDKYHHSSHHHYRGPARVMLSLLSSISPTPPPPMPITTHAAMVAKHWTTNSSSPPPQDDDHPPDSSPP